MAREEKKTDDAEQVLADMKAVEDRKQRVIDDLLRQREAAIKEIDDKKVVVVKEFAEKLAKLGYRESSGKRRNHHKKSPAAPVPEPKPKPKG